MGHRDSGFFTFGQLNNFVRKLCYRALLPKHLPKDTDWTQLPVLRTADLRQLSSRDFLTRLRLKQDLDAAATAKVKRDHCDQEGPISNMTSLVEEAKEKFVAKARSYIVTLLENFLGHVSLNANIVCGMACFDPSILLCLPLEQANFCFSALYQSFSLRGWLEGSPENDCREEYLDFIGHFRQAYHSLKDAHNGFPDMINLLSSMPELRNRAHLHRLFQLSCMCLTENTPLLPPIRFHDVDAQRPKCSLGDVLLPAQSYLARVPGALSICTKDDSLSKLREIEQEFNTGNVAGDPWTHVDVFGKADFYKVLWQKHKSLSQKTKSPSSSRSASRSTSPTTSKRRKESPGKGKRKVGFRSASPPMGGSATPGPVQSAAKP